MTAFEVRRARPEDARGLAELFAAVAEERDGIATEPPVDVDARTKQFEASIGTILAVAAGDFVGSLHVDASRFGVVARRLEPAISDGSSAGGVSWVGTDRAVP